MNKALLIGSILILILLIVLLVMWKMKLFGKVKDCVYSCFKKAELKSVVIVETNVVKIEDHEEKLEEVNREPTRRELLLKYRDNLDRNDKREGESYEKERVVYDRMLKNNKAIKQEFQAMRENSKVISENLHEAGDIVSRQIERSKVILTLQTVDIETLCGKNSNNNSLDGN